MGDVADFAYVKNMGRVQYAYAQVVVWSISGKEVEKIVTNLSAKLYYLDPIEINGDVLHSVVNIMKQKQVHPKSNKGDDLIDPIFARTPWYGEKDMVVHSMPSLLMLPFVFKPIITGIS